MNATATITIVDDVKIVVPDAIDLTTPYVLFEQQDWFEDEIKFVRKILKAGQNVIDIGANYGVYALSMARRVGPGGKVWAFEPASNTANLLAEGISANRFSQVVLERSALSNVGGTAELSLHGNAEENSLARNKQVPGASESVSVVTLDECLQRYDWRNIDFLKLDAEGEEANILKGGERFFNETSPLVQYEIVEGSKEHFDLVKEFAARGYESYRLVPGLALLVPFDEDSIRDPFLLNLFCCKRDRANRLAADGFLLPPAAPAPTTAGVRADDFAATADDERFGWRNTIAKMPYGISLAQYWSAQSDAGMDAEVKQALALYALSRDRSCATAARFQALQASLALLKELCAREPKYLRLASLARVARDFGARSLAVDCLHQLGAAIARHNQVDPTEPFLAPAERFDSIPPGDAICNWVLAAALEEIERLSSFSSFFTGTDNRQRLEVIRGLGFGSEEMARRLYLINARADKAGA